MILNRKGLNNGRNKLTEADVHVARWLSKIGTRQGYIADIMGTNRTTINKAVSGASWSHLERKTDLFSK